MAFLKAGFGFEGVPHVRGRGVILRQPAMSDYVAWAEVRARSRDHLTRWEPQWARDELTRSAYRRRLRHYQREAREDLGYSFLVCSASDDRVMGGLTLSSVRRGVSQSASLGYWLGLPYTNQGLMSDAVGAIVPFAFGTLRLHRLEAATMPANVASIRVLERNGFVREGFADQYLKINGTWEDHFLFGLLSTRVRAGGGAPQ